MLVVLRLVIWLSLSGSVLCRAAKEIAPPPLDTRRHEEVINGSAATTGDDFLDFNIQLRKLLQDGAPLVWGGEPAPENRFPYACSLRTLGTRIHGCGGVLIAKRWVLTAAHCVSGPDSIGATPVVYVGAYGINDEASAEVRTSTKVFFHENWSGDPNNGYDIALLLLDEESTKQPLRLPDPSETLGPNQIVVAMGWGRTSQFGALPDVLQMATKLEYVDTGNCQRVWPEVTENMLCAHATSASTCGGDSGGPLVIPDTHHGQALTDGDPGFDMLVGLVSFGPDDCGQTEEGKFKPGVYTRVSSFRQWIDEKMGNSGSTPPPPPPPEEDEEPPPTEKDGTPPIEDNNDEGEQPSDDGDKVDKVLTGASNGNLKAVEQGISDGVDVDVRSQTNSTPLINAARYGHLNVVQYLLDQGADIEAKDEDGFTPLIRAAVNNHVDVVKALLDSGANKEARDNEGRTALAVATGLNSYSAMRELIAWGADVNTESTDEYQPIHFASLRADNEEGLTILLEGGADLNAKTGSLTPVLLATVTGHKSNIEFLLDQGAELDSDVAKENLCGCVGLDLDFRGSDLCNFDGCENDKDAMLALFD